MSQRLVAACVAVPAVLALLVYAMVSPLPYATYRPGGTVDVLASDPDNGGAEIIQVDGTETYRDDGSLLMTTVQVSPPADVDETPGENLLSLLSTWRDGDNAVYPYDYVHDPEETPEANREAGRLQMTTSQDTAVDIALAEMDVVVPQVVQVVELTPDLPAADVLEVGDVITSIGGRDVERASDLVRLISQSPAGEPLAIGVERGGKELDLEVTPVEDPEQDRSIIGILPEVADYEFPYEVKINISPAIGGPSAGLIFSLAVYDTLTEGSLTGGRTVAGSGELLPDGSVGAIGGIAQKVAGARDQGADLFLVPIENCADALTADNGDMRLVMAETMHDARLALETYAADEDAALPSCEDADEILAAAAR